MALADYYLCDKCGNKSFYDSGMDYDRAGDIKALCCECAIKFKIIIVEKESLVIPEKTQDGIFERRLYGMTEKLLESEK